jgi:AcrR family transcriptional regulator
MSTPAPTTGRPHSRDAIRSAAEKLFAGRGYAATSVRDIAASAGVDAALIIRHFGSKEQLFLETMRVEFDQLDLDPPLQTLGERLIHSLLDADDHVRGAYLALVWASDAGEVSSALRTAHDDDFVAPLAARLEGEDADLRARLAAALIGGLFYALWIVRDEVLLATPHDDLAQRYGALLQRLITP